MDALNLAYAEAGGVYMGGKRTEAKNVQERYTQSKGKERRRLFG